MVKKDCFAWNENLNQCVALKDTYCRKGECSFYREAKERCMACRRQVYRTHTCDEDIAVRNCQKRL